MISGVAARLSRRDLACTLAAERKPPASRRNGAGQARVVIARSQRGPSKATAITKMSAEPASPTSPICPGLISGSAMAAGGSVSDAYWRNGVQRAIPTDSGCCAASQALE